MGALGGAVGWGTALQAGRSLVLFRMVSFPLTYRPQNGPLLSTPPLTEVSTRCLLGLRRPVCRADNLTTIMCRLSWNLGISASWNRQGLSSSVQGLLYLLGVRMGALPPVTLTSLKKVNFRMTGCLLVDLLIIEWYIFPGFIQVLISSWHLCWKCLLKRLRRVYEVTPPTTNE